MLFCVLSLSSYIAQTVSILSQSEPNTSYSSKSTMASQGAFSASELTVFCSNNLISFPEITPWIFNLMSFKTGVILLPSVVVLLHLFLLCIAAVMPQWRIRPHCPVMCMHKECPWNKLLCSGFIIQIDFLGLYPANRNFPSGQFSTQCRVISPL